MKNTLFTHPVHGSVALGTMAVAITGYQFMRGWVLLRMIELDSGVWMPDRQNSHPIPTHYAGTRAEVAACLIAGGCVRVE